MKKITDIIQIVIYALAAIAGLYFGIWWAFIGGIIDIIDEVNRAIAGEPLVALRVAAGIAKIMFAGLIGWAAFVIGAFLAGLVGSSYEEIRIRQKRTK